MTFKKIRGLESETIFETKVSDGTGKVMSKWKCLKDDFPNVVKILNDKFALNIEVRRTNKIKDELSWAK